MGKQGPCYHCGVTSTPLWRNGPPDKPVLCNACGSRWRTKGTLANYTPLHARADPDDYDENRASRLKSMSINKSKEMKALKRKSNHDNVAMGGTPLDHYQGNRKAVDEDTSNRSSSGSAISNSESCAQFGSADASDLTGPAQSNVWDTTVPSRKRTCVSRPKQSPVEKLTKDLYNILHEQQSSYFSGSSEDDLLFESETPMVSVEIGHGSVLIRHPSSIAREEESEASSVSVENKQYSSNEAYSRSLPVYNDNGGGNFSSRCFEKSKNSTGHGIQPDQVKREKSQNEKPQILGNHKSPLCNIDLNDVLNFQEFMVWLTNEEQHQLLEFLPSVDKTKLPDSLKSMFDSLQFKENISSFQQLLAEGVFDLSFSGAKTEDCRTLQRLALSDMATSNWVGQYHSLKKCKNGTGVPADTKGSYTSSPNNVVNMKRSRDGQTHKFPEVKNTMKSPRRMNQKASYENRELIDSDSSCFSPKSLFALPTDGSSLMLEPLQFADESSDQDLLLDVPSNSSFPQAELLHPTSSFSQQASNSSSSAYPNLVQP